MTLLLASSPALSADPPDAGQTLQELRRAPSLPRASRGVVVETPTVGKPVPGGPQITLQSVIVNGNSIFSDDVLLTAIGDIKGKKYDLAGLKDLAGRITAFYHANDYPFARAFIPAQTFSDGTLEIEVIEGRYGEITVQGDDSRDKSAQKFLSSLKKGEVIEGKNLERTSLILDDQPGYEFTPIVRPGQEMGTGDLSFRMKREKRFGGRVAGDNYGNRYTGRARGQAGFYANSPFMFGDQITLNTIYTEESMWYGSAGYNLPLGSTGLRGNIGYTHTYYELGKEFSSLDAHGTAQIASAGLSYPLVRSQDKNLSISATYQHKWLTDEQDVAGTDDKKSSDVLPIAFGFDLRDDVWGGAVTYGNLGWTHGVLDLDSTLAAADVATAQSDGGFDKFNLDIVRLQGTPVENLSLYGRASGQLSADNLDSSEDFGLGGPSGVRAYPTGESYGDEGWLAQMEIRYMIHSISPYIFYDYGTSRTNHDPWTSGDNRRSIGGGGFGTRFSYGKWDADLSVAWRTVGGDPQSDSRDAMPVIWFSAGYNF